MPHPKYKTISNWKSRGLIYDDYDELYEIYIKTMKCQYCNKEFNNNTDRCLDHDHNTGLFRKIVCRACNVNDSYIKYPDGYDKKKYNKQYRQDNKEVLNQKKKQYKNDNLEEITQKRKQKITCLCGSVISNSVKARHQKSQKHLKNMDKYMENID